MKLSVSQTAKLSGVSVRTLHYYDKIGLLAPAGTSDAGYRYYDEASLSKLQQILFYRELDFPLKQIKEIITQPNYDEKEALRSQKNLLLLKQKRLSRLITLIDNTLKGENTVMNFKEFDKEELNQAKGAYAQEAKEKWGDTQEFEESQEKTAQYSKEEWDIILKEQDDIMKAFAQHRDKQPSDTKVQELVLQWHGHINQYYYTCPKEILNEIGQMYVQDERFLKNLEQYGEGTAQLISLAIEEYCKK